MLDLSWIPDTIRPALEAILITADLNHRLAGYFGGRPALAAALRYVTDVSPRLAAELCKAVGTGDFAYRDLSPTLERLQRALVNDAYKRADLSRYALLERGPFGEQLTREGFERQVNQDLETSDDWRLVQEQRLELAAIAGRRLPPDLAERHTETRETAEAAFREAKRMAGPRSDLRRLLIDVQILPEVIEYAHCWFAAAGRGLVHMREVARLVEDELRIAIRRGLSDIVPLELVLDSDVREADEWVKESPKWRAYLTELRSLTESLTANAVVQATNVRRKGQRSSALADNIERYRMECGWTIEKLAEKTGITISLVKRHRDGFGAYPDTLKKYADAFTEALKRPITTNDLIALAKP